MPILTADDTRKLDRMDADLRVWWAQYQERKAKAKQLAQEKKTKK